MTVRFAPSPTGRFHLGNLRTAWISHRMARELGLPWWVRFEDIDGPRVVPGAREQQLADLAQLGLTPDHIEIQSQNIDLHWQVFLELLEAQVIFPCTCSRKEVQEELAVLASAPQTTHATPSPFNTIYSGHCLTHPTVAPVAAATKPVAWRIRSSGVVIARTERLSLNYSRESRQAMRFEPAYHWACAIDDARNHPEHQILVRAWDLAQATPIQRKIQEHWRGPSYIPPAVFHTSLIVQNNGHRLEKRTQGITLPEWISSQNSITSLTQAFEASFSFPPPHSLERGSVSGEKLQSLSLADLFSYSQQRIK